MENPGYIALSHQLALQREMSVVANNIANMNTPAFKAEKMIFLEHVTKPTRKESLSFVQDFGMARDLTEGPITPTGNDLDLAISGYGYFAVNTPQGVRYTRHGRFQLDAQGRIVDVQGQPVQAVGGGPITVPIDSGRLTIASDGTVNDDKQKIGQIAMFEFANEQNLKREANGLYAQGDQQPKAATGSKMLQGMLEQSNVEPITEMTRMIQIHRSYQATQQLMQSEHQQAMRAIDRLASTRTS